MQENSHQNDFFFFFFILFSLIFLGVIKNFLGVKKTKTFILELTVKKINFFVLPIYIAYCILFHK